MEKQKKKHGKRYCKLCGNLLQKRGKTGNGSQRWFCKFCNNSTIDKRTEQRLISQINTFLEWALSKKTIKETAGKICRKTFYNRAKKILEIEPQISKTGEVYNCLLADSTCIKKQSLLLLKTTEYVVGYRWAESENKDDYIVLFSGFAPPKYLVSDGHSSIESACKKIWKTTKIQRCLVHIDRFVRNHVGVRPTEPAKLSIRKLAGKLFKIDTLKKAKNWTLLFLSEYEKFKDIIEEKRPLPNPGKKTHYHVYKRLHDAWHHVMSALKKGHLFTFLEDALTDKNIKCPHDTNSLEGGINARVKELCRSHRGTTSLLEQRIVEWYLVTRSEHSIEAVIRDFLSQKPPHFYT